MMIEEKAIGGFSKPSKMPCFSYGIPAKKCNIGSILNKVKGSVCHKCYARKGFYAYASVAKAQAKRLRILQKDLPGWTANMIKIFQSYQWPYFRWHDSGDLQSKEHLAAIVEIAKANPKTRFWLPTKEYALVRNYGKKFPANLTVRVSAPMIGESVPPIPGTVTSTVGAGKGTLCEAKFRGGFCGPCRACWDPKVKNVDYALH